LIREALAARGTRYRWGGASRGGFDCSGFTRYLFARIAGMKLPHSASAQAKLGKKVTREVLKPGDLLFFRTYRRGISHVGLYIGGDKFVHAASTRRRVRVDSLNEPYYRNRFVTARRLKEFPSTVEWGAAPPEMGTAPLKEAED
jgi:peptidoglycan endopeptidase LytF